MNKNLGSFFCFLLCIFSAQFSTINATEVKKIVSYKEKNDEAESFLKATNEKDLMSIPHVRRHNSAPQFRPKFKHKYKWQYPMEIVDSEVTGYIHTPNSEVRHIEKLENEVIYDAIYTFDEFSRRINPIPLTSNYKRYVALFGCSFTYGNGLNDNETIHYHLTELSEETYGYNYAIGASGPHMMLGLLQSIDIQKQTSLLEGSFVYIYNSFHIQRANTFLTETIWTGKTPFFEMKSGQLVRDGTIESKNKFKFELFKFLRVVFGYFNYQKNYPKVNKHHKKYTCDLIVESKKVYESKNPGSTFYVYAHPIDQIDKYMESCLRKNNVETIISKISVDKNIHQLKYDGHPNSQLNLLIAKEIINYLSRK